jgi:hypothetical protein
MHHAVIASLPSQPQELAHTGSDTSAEQVSTAQQDQQQYDQIGMHT